MKTVNIEEAKRKEQLIIDGIKNGTLASEIINGELKIQLEEGLDLVSIPGKPVPYISLTIAKFSAEGRNEQVLNSKICPTFIDTSNFSTAVRIPLTKLDKNKISEVIQINVYMQSKSYEVATPSDSVFIGQYNLSWKQLLTNNMQWLAKTESLIDDFSGRCP